MVAVSFNWLAVKIVRAMSNSCFVIQRGMIPESSLWFLITKHLQVILSSSQENADGLATVTKRILMLYLPLYCDNEATDCSISFWECKNHWWRQPACLYMDWCRRHMWISPWRRYPSLQKHWSHRWCSVTLSDSPDHTSQSAIFCEYRPMKKNLMFFFFLFSLSYSQTSFHCSALFGHCTNEFNSILGLD